MAAKREALFYMGRNIEDLTREELIEALYRSVAETNSTREMAMSANKTWCAIAKGLAHSRV